MTKGPVMAETFHVRNMLETAIISVGDNSYGHPTQEAMDRLSQAGAEIYRTDRQGNILVTVHGGD